jgi:hypothetical protein
VVETGAKSGILERALQRYHELIFSNATVSPTLPELLELRVVCDGGAGICGDTAVLSESSDEAYELLLIPSSVGQSTLQARSVWGLLRGLETFSQMVERRPRGFSGGRTERSVRAVPVQVVDAPRYRYVRACIFASYSQGVNQAHAHM